MAAITNINQPPPVGSWCKSPFIIWAAEVQGIGTKPLGTFAIGDNLTRSSLWSKTKL